MIGKTAPFWILVHLEIIKLYSKLGEEIVCMISGHAQGK